MELDRRSPVEFLRQLTDLMRTHLVELVAQYSAAFPDDKPPKILSAFIVMQSERFLK